ncbi:glycerol-3-phosphate ABC transporter substrate-binding protein [Jeotgalibacillus alimentarius]|uniref:Glycerol-3-phosphate ABC transporter substrate-binding protein n=1 Tax=Jeotgalibacillus alimentarius TaxID=135826 RepID=A0A0C2VFH7_9BACL|nr:ABC transporter substrate-binding protein [Jeotgalibacillus alimentarius]KIL42773.1 glycerol-3-phosphate ABC transporter substrate-binding protein [Jeotgalibacillus alimentarius]
MKKLWIGSTAMALLLAACTSETEEAVQTTDATAAPAEDTGKTEVVFWHAMSGELETALNTLVDDFNASQEEYEVEPVFQGTYEEALTKLNTVAGTDESPAMMQVFEVGTKFMIDSGHIQPVQDFIDEEGFDTSIWEENITNYYSVDGVQYSMPFNSSTPVLIYNKDAFEAAGLDPEKSPMTYSELKEAAAALTEGEQKGFSILNYGWFFEELVAAQGGLFVDAENGREGQATEAVFNGEEGLNVFNLIKDMHDEGTFYNSGQNWDDMRAAFQSGATAMILDSSAGVKGMIDNAPFEVGVGYLPVPDDAERNGVIIGGASLWMADDIEAEQKQGAWEFMKYASSAEAQAQWHVDTGYFAINPAAYEEQIVVDQWAEYPQLKVTVDQLKETQANAATGGALISVFPEARQRVVNAMESLYQGADPQEALDQAAEETNRALEVDAAKNGN